MAVDKSGKWVGFGVGDTDPAEAARTDPNWHAVSLLTAALHAWGGAKFFPGPQPNYDLAVAKAVADFCQHSQVHLPVVFDAQGNAVANLTVRKKLGAFPPPPPPSHAMFTIRGTGGIIGQDYTSQLAQQVSPWFHEHPIDYLADMGGLPVGVVSGPNAPSGDECSIQCCQMLADAVLGSTVSFGASAYSLGTKGLILFLNRLFDPNDVLYPHRNRLVCVVMIADPWRPFGKSFYMGPIQAGEGIGTPNFTMSKAAQDALGYRCCWLVHPADLYTNAPLGGTGAVLSDIEQIILGASVSDPLGTMKLAITQLMKVVTKDSGLMQTLGGGAAGGMGIPGLLTGVAGGSLALTFGLAGMMLPVLESGFQGLISGIAGNGTNLPVGIAADVQAAILALKFYGSGIAPHLSYHDTPWSANGPQTFLQLGIQHAGDWGSRTPVQV